MCACEPSGDLYASYFIKNWLEKENFEIFGIGGENLSKNIKLVYDYKNLKTFGFASGIFSSIKNYKVYKKIARAIYKIKPEIFIAVAYPGINLLLCRYAKKIGATTIYFVPPQLWAWGGFRKYFLKKWTDLIISIFPFEYHYYKKQNIRTIHWQNPLINELKKYKRNDDKTRIGMMPGSRKNEINRNLPVLIDVVQALEKNRGNRPHQIEYCLILHSDYLSEKKIDNNLLATAQCCNREKENLDFNFSIITENRYQTMRNCDVLLICSGTASLEAGFMQIPQIFFNRPNFLDYYLFRHLIKIKEYNLTNLYFGRNVIPSFVMRDKKELVKKILFKLKKMVEDRGINCDTK